MHSEAYDLICFSDQRWGCVYERAYHLLTRAARHRRVFFFEEPIYEVGVAAHLSTYRSLEGVVVVEPILPVGSTPSLVPAMLRRLLDELIAEQALDRAVLWFTSPQAIGFAHHLEPLAIIYDCCDDLSRFRGAPSTLAELETFLLIAADLVFVGGRGLYEAKLGHHDHLHFFPSAVDTAHFARARRAGARERQPIDQGSILGPRIGYSGMIDDRLDLALVSGLAELRPDLQLVMVGPVAAATVARLPRRPNLHWLGSKPYGELPSYLAGWSAAFLPFVRDDSTKFLAPTTLEYLAAGVPVIATPLADVVYPYGELGLVRIADTADTMAQAIDATIAESNRPRTWHTDRWLAQLSWDRVWHQMDELIVGVVRDHEDSSSGEPVPVAAERSSATAIAEPASSGGGAATAPVAAERRRS